MTGEDEVIECCEGGVAFGGPHPATRMVYPFLDEDDGVYAVCDDDSHSPIDVRRASEIEPLPRTAP